MSDKIRLFLDIDGCVNAWGSWASWGEGGTPEDMNEAVIHPEHNDYGDHVGPTDRLKYLIKWNPKLVDALNGLDPAVELVWTTTWREDARLVGEAIGLERKQSVLHPLGGVTRFPSISWKWGAIHELQTSSPCPFIAVDDEWGLHYKREVLESLGGLVVQPIAEIGVSERNFKSIQEYVDSHLTKED